MTDARTLTQDELLTEARDRFGNDPLDWAFRCPGCGDVASGYDFRKALEENPRKNRDSSPTIASDIVGQECIGRALGALSRTATYTGRGCNWAAYGLFGGPWTIALSNGRTMYGFPLADAIAPAAALIEETETR